jgi:competence protein ComEA
VFASQSKLSYVLGASGLLLFTVVGYFGMRQSEHAKPAELHPTRLVELDKARAPSQTEEQAHSDAPEQVVIHIVGAVKKPGLLKLPHGSRVDDAIRESGGTLPKADLHDLNLAAKLIDGSQLYVPSAGAAPITAIAEPYQGARTGADLYRPKRAASSSSSSGLPAPGSISLNTGSMADFDRLPGVGPATAQKILDYRMDHGGFGSIQEITAVKGIGPKKYEAMRKYLKL